MLVGQRTDEWGVLLALPGRPCDRPCAAYKSVYMVRTLCGGFGCSEPALALGVGLAAAGGAHLLGDPNGAYGGDPEPGALLVGEAELPAEFIGAEEYLALG